MKVNVLCHAERLPDYKDGKTYFSLNLSAALQDVPADDFNGDAVSPWKWTVGKIHVYVEKAGKIKKINPIDTTATTANPKFIDQLTNVRAGFLQDMTRFRFVPDSTATLDADATQLRWHEFLIHASTFPAALAHEANLSFVFAVETASLDGDRLIAAPEITIDGNPHEPLDENEPDLTLGTKLHYVQIGKTPKTDPPFFYEWLYDDHGQEPSVAAYQRECLLQPVSDRDQFLDLDSGWIKVTDGVDTSKEDWSLELEQRVSEAFDLTQRMLEGVGGAVITTTAQRDELVNACFAACRDLAGVGIRATSPGAHTQTLAEAVLLALKPKDMDKPLRDKALAALIAYDKTVDRASWRKMLTDSITTNLFGDLANDAVIVELRRIHGLLTNEGVLRDLLIAQWDAAFASSTELTTFFSLAKERARRDVLPQFNLRRNFLLEALQEVWTDVSKFDLASKPEEQRKQLGVNLKNALRTYFKERFAQTAGPFKTFRPAEAAPSSFAADIETHLDKYAEELAASERLIRVDPGGSTERDALVVQVADVVRSHGEASEGADQQESSRRISGYGVLMKQTKIDPSDWRCLNFALVVEPKSRKPLLEAAVPVPLRLGYRNGMRQTFVVYENQPLVAQGPMQLAMKHQLVEQSGGSDGSDDFFAYANPYGIGGDPERLCPLIYGENYDVAVFAIGNSGAMPRGLEKTGEPTVMRKVKDAVPAADTIRKLPFRRRTLVGLPRVRAANQQPSAAAFEKLALPPIPDTVLPLARSLKPDGNAEDAENGSTSSRPLLLLRHQSGFDEFAFALHAPTVDLSTWDRWVSNKKDPATLKRRINVIADFHKRADDAGPTMSEEAKREDLSLEDPAVSHWVFKLRQRWNGEKLGDGTADPPSKTIALATLDDAHFKPVQVTVKIGAANIDITDPAKIVVTVPEKQVWVLEIHPAVPTAERKDRFAEKLDREPFGTLDTLTLFHPFALEVEVPPKKLEFPAELLRKALLVAPEGPRANQKDLPDQLVVRLNPTELTTALSPWMHRVEVVVQQWRWSGRPIARPKKVDGKITLQEGFDFVLPVTAEDDAVLFADRSPLDVLVIPAMVDFIAAKDSSAEVVLHRRDLSRTPGALYFRIAFRCFNRYEGILDASGDSRSGGDTENWTRVIVKSTWAGPAPQPVVKLIVPLTRPLGSDGTPPLLAVLDEPWGDVGGLAEELVAKIVDVAVTDLEIVKSQLNGESTLPEVGPDPILSLTRIKKKVEAQPPIGPIGYTFDTDTDAPLFTKTSFLLPPPKIEGTPDLSWFFVKMQFLRRLRAQGTVDGQMHESSATQPVWCQYLPPSTRFATQSGATIDVKDLRVTKTAQVPAFTNTAGDVVLLMPAEREKTSRSWFQLFALVTEPVTDAAGRPDQEAFVGIYPIDPATGAIAPPSPAPDLTTRILRARIVEVQARVKDLGDVKNPLEGGKLFDLLFTKENEDAAARIVRISPPIDPL